MIVNGLHGSFFMLSGGAFHRYDLAGGECYYDLPSAFVWDGTIVLMKIPTDIPESFDYNKFIIR